MMIMLMNQNDGLEIVCFDEVRLEKNEYNDLQLLLPEI